MLPSSQKGDRWVVFDDGRVAFQVPRWFAMHRERDETVAVYPPGNDSGITLRLSLHTKPLDRRMPKDVAEQFLRDEAARREVPLHRLGDGLYFTETGTAEWPDRQVQMQYWQVAVGRILVVASATIWGRDREAPTVQRALAAVPQILESIRYT
jgi:hypothetical protein